MSTRKKVFDVYEKKGFRGLLCFWFGGCAVVVRWDYNTSAKVKCSCVLQLNFTSWNPTVLLERE